MLSDIGESVGNTIDVNGRDIEISEIVNGISRDNTYFSQLRDLRLNSLLLESDSEVLRNMARAEIDATLSDIWINSENDRQISDFANRFGGNSGDVNFIAREDSREEPYKGLTYVDVRDTVTIPDVEDNQPVAEILTSDGEEYVAILTRSGDNYAINQLYDLQGNLVDNDLNVFFKHFMVAIPDDIKIVVRYPVGWIYISRTA